MVCRPGRGARERAPTGRAAERERLAMRELDVRTLGHRERKMVA